MKNFNLFEWNRLKKNGYTLEKHVENQLRKVSSIPYETGTTDYLKNRKIEEKKLYENTKMEEFYLREEFSRYRSSLNSPSKLLEIQRLLNSRVPMQDKRGVVLRDVQTGIIQYAETFQREPYKVYLGKVKNLKVSSILLENEYDSTVIYTNMIDEAEGRSFLARARVENLEELSGILRK